MPLEQRELIGQLDAFTLIALGIDVNAVKNPVILGGKYRVAVSTDMPEEEFNKARNSMGLEHLLKIGKDSLRITSWDEIQPLAPEEEEDPLWLD